MKHILTFLFLTFTAFTTSAQSIIQDSSWMTNSAGIFTVYRLQTYDNGNTTLTSTKVGDTTAVLNGAINVYRQQGATMASDAVILSANGAKIREIVRQDGQMQTQINKSALNAIALQVDTSTIQGQRYFTSAAGWVLRDAGTTTAVAFSFGPTGALRYKNGTETVKLAYCLGNVLRLNNYKNSGKALDLYKMPIGVWASIDLGEVLAPAAAGLRSVAIAEESAPKAAQTTLYSTGLIATQEDGTLQYYKYDSKKKTWVKYSEAAAKKWMK
jgi:hypothetical protein